MFLGLILGRKPWFDPFRPHLPPHNIYIVGKLCILGFIWRWAIEIWSILQAIRILLLSWDRIMHSYFNTVSYPNKTFFSQYLSNKRDYCQTVISFALTSRVGVWPAGLSFPGEEKNRWNKIRFLPAQKLQGGREVSRFLIIVGVVIINTINTTEVVNNSFWWFSPQNVALLSIRIHCVTTRTCCISGRAIALSLVPLPAWSEVVDVAAWDHHCVGDWDDDDD